MGSENTDHNGAIDYMLRTTQQHHVQLSTMADQKANIMIASSSILLTFSFANVDQDDLAWGFVALFVFAFASLIMAVLAVTPRVTNGPTPPNPLFFGHFTTMSLDDYRVVMDDVMRTEKATYDAIVTDIYSIGSALKSKKYKYLRLSYRCFLTGILTAGLLFGLQIAFF